MSVAIPSASDLQVVEPKVNAVPVVPSDKVAEKVVEKPKESPAKDLREIQALIANGIFPGNVAPSIVKAYNLLEQMAQVVEKEASKDAK